MHRDRQKVAGTFSTLVVHTANMGDVVSAAGLVRALADTRGGVEILVRSPFRGLFAGEAGIREISEDQLNQSGPYELCLDLDSSQTSRKIIREVKATRKVGRYLNWLRRFKYGFHYNLQVPKRPYDHIVRDYEVVGNAVGISQVPNPRLSKIPLTPDLQTWLVQISATGDEVVVLAPEASNPIRSLPKELTENLLHGLTEHRRRVVLVGLEKAEMVRLCALFEGQVFWRPFTIQEVKALFSWAPTFIGCDSGPMHLASAMGMNVIALFGPTRPANYGPPIKKGIFIEQEFPCRPCNQNKPCPYERRCFTTITATEVLAGLGLIDESR